MTKSNLPAVVGNTQVRVLTSNEGPPKIMRRLADYQFMPDKESLAREASRYAELQVTSPEEKAVLTVHKALEEGRALVDLSTIVRQPGGYRDEYGINRDADFPALGIAHIGDERIFCRIRNTNDVEFRRGPRGKKIFYSFSDNRYGRGLANNSWIQRYAVVPPMPPELARIHTKNDPNKLIVWEATWHRDSESRPPRPRDPALLEWVAGSLYSVVAVWELSPIEAAILGPRAT